MKALIFCMMLISDSCLAEALENVNPEKLVYQCAEYLSDEHFIGTAIAKGRDCDQMKEWTAETPDVPEERRKKIARILDEACDAEDIHVWFETKWKRCLGK